MYVSVSSGTYNIIVIIYNIYNDVLNYTLNLDIRIIDGWYYNAQYTTLEYLTYSTEYNT